MANNDFSRFSKKVVQYFWDPLPRNEDEAQIWCLGRSYDSRYHDARQPKALGTSPSADSDTSNADSAVVTNLQSKPEDAAALTEGATGKGQADLSRSEEEALGWPPEFLDDLESRIWLTYRSNFPPIPKSSDPAATTAMSFSTKLRNLGNQTSFTSDTGWGCMIRSGQSMLANTLLMLQLSRDWRKGQQEQELKALLALFADAPEAPFSIHKFVEHGAQACGKHPGEWFGPSATARCIQ
jgi:cysteine protease ATG4